MIPRQAEIVGSRLPNLGPGILLRLLAKRAQPVNAGIRIQTVFSLPALGEEALFRYINTFDFEPGRIPLPYYFILAQRAQVASMVLPRFPVSAAGLLHARNELAIYACASPTAPITCISDCTIDPAPDGRLLICFDQNFEQGDKLVAFNRTDYLTNRRTGTANEKSRAKESANYAGLSEIAGWELDHRSGFDYARLVGDYNPIHLFGWTARPLGSPRPIIHGMHTFGKAISMIEQSAHAPVIKSKIWFSRPIPLGSSVRLWTNEAHTLYEVRTSGAIAAHGTAQVELDQRL